MSALLPTLWNVPTTPRLMIDQKPSMVCVWTAPTTYCSLAWSMTAVRIFFAEMFITNPLIGTEQADFVGNSFMHESFERGSADVIDNASNHVALALYGADNWRL